VPSGWSVHGYATYSIDSKEGNLMTARRNTITALALGTLALIVIVVVLTGSYWPFVIGSMTSFIILAVIAFGICVINVLSLARFGWTSPTYWTNPASIIGVALGIASLVLIIITFIGVTESTMAFTVLGVIVFARVGVKIWQNAVLNISLTIQGLE
jgi:hypothetical protein